MKNLPETIESEEKEVNLGEFNREEFMRRIGNELYRGVSKRDIQKKYELAHKMYMLVQDKGVWTTEPLPPSLEGLGREPTDEELAILEEQI